MLLSLSLIIFACSTLMSDDFYAYLLWLTAICIAQDLYPKSFKMLEQLTNPIKITIGTSLSFILGVLFIGNLEDNFPSKSALLIAIIVIVSMGALPLLLHNQQSYLQIAKYTLTTFIFGVIDGLCLFQIQNLQPFSIYLMVMTAYYYGQFQLVNCFHHQILTWHSFLIYHSKQYTAANIAMLFEHFVTRYLLNLNFKQFHILMIPALAIMIAGLILRITAFFTAQRNFTHVIRTKKIQDHELVTNGVYSILRHPSYTGFFYFSVFSMVFIGNFVCTVGFCFALHNFFQDRIEYEEYYLHNFFPDYDKYCKKTYILIPFVSGYDPEKQD